VAVLGVGGFVVQFPLGALADRYPERLLLRACLWAGLVGAMVAAALVGWGAALLVPLGPSATVLAAAGAGLAIVAQAGDLLESWIKRRFQVKDTSRLIPGHGGLLDRLDGVLAAAPVAALLSFAVGYGRLLWEIP
jgi:phosphatidate cytidylyltransferase